MFLKVRKSRKQSMVSSILPKNKWKSLLICSLWDLRTPQYNLFLRLSDLYLVSPEKLPRFRFFKCSWVTTTYFSWDLLTFFWSENYFFWTKLIFFEQCALPHIAKNPWHSAGNRTDLHFHRPSGQTSHNPIEFIFCPRGTQRT